MKLELPKSQLEQQSHGATFHEQTTQGDKQESEAEGSRNINQHSSEYSLPSAAGPPSGSDWVVGEKEMHVVKRKNLIPFWRPWEGEPQQHEVSVCTVDIRQEKEVEVAIQPITCCFHLVQAKTEFGV